MKSEVRSWLALAVVLVAAVAIHLGSLSAPFFADDYLFLDQARGRSLPALLASPDPLGNYFRPISRQVWFWSLARATGESPRAFHVANLVLFLLTLVALHRLARRFLPPHAALAGVAVVALHHAADVPLLWASGSQDLLAVLGSLLAIELHASGRRGWAALSMALALLSKETVIFAPVLALIVARRPGEPMGVTLRRGWPQLAVLGGWLVTWLATTARRPAMSLEVHPVAAGIPATLVHLLQSAVGLEIPYRGLGGALHAPPPLALIPTLAALAWLSFARPSRGPRKERSAGAPRRALVVGAVWALLAAAPVVAVAEIWSAYYYLFALCGVALVVGALVAPLPPWAALVPALIVGTTSENGRRLTEFAIERGVWSTQSHLNRHYFARGMSLADHVLADLRRLRPELPRRSTLYFAGLPRSIAFQAGDGPLVRWAYRDSSLRSYYFTRFELAQALRGPVFFFSYRRDSLVEITGSDSLDRVALSLILGDAARPARDLLLLAWRTRPEIQTAYRLAWLQATIDSLPSSRPWLDRANVVADAGPTPEIPVALQAVTRGDTASAISLMSRAIWRHGLDPGAHALMADLLLTTSQVDLGAVEAYAVRALTPDDPSAWRRWGFVQAVRQRDQEAVQSLERYLALARIRESDDPQVAQTLQALRRRVPGGDIAQAELGKVK